LNLLPEALLLSLKEIPGFDLASFVRAHESGEQVTSIRINPMKIQNSNLSIRNSKSEILIKSPVPWSTYGYYLSERPFFTFDPLLHAGAYYVQEASSMFLEQAVKQSLDVSQPLRALDLCAAPGGKSTLLQSVLSPGSLLVSNEVIKQRAAILEENLTKWGAVNTVITNNDPADFSVLEGFFDLLVIDAPCSGSGLFRRDPQAISEWSPEQVQLCSRRQQRILADAWPSLRENGVLIYATCSYSMEENEQVVDWLAHQFNIENIRLEISPAWGIEEVQSGRAKAYGYRFFPGKVQGEGLFMACFRKKEGDTAAVKAPKKPRLQKLTHKEAGLVEPWLQPNAAVQLWKYGELIYALPQDHVQEILTISDKLYLRKAGVLVGKMTTHELLPDHALAMSNLVNGEIVAISLKQEEALQYLRKENVMIDTSHKGRALVQFSGINLGWINVLSNRINNYYPVAWRILKSGSN
jgi:16S rRNA C967 or C1407 C5-methylase (RsmB/RsmF family)/NOL1/NOP2/fmu family ribosome biogenesis protein